MRVWEGNTKELESWLNDINTKHTIKIQGMSQNVNGTHTVIYTVEKILV